MVGETLNWNARATARSPTRDRPASDATTLFSNDFWAVAFFSAIGLLVSLALAYATLGSGIDLTIGAVPIDMAVPVGQ